MSATNSPRLHRKPQKKIKWSTISKVLFVVFGIISAAGVFFDIFVNSNKTILPNLRLPFIHRSVATTKEMEFAMDVIKALYEYYGATQSEVTEESNKVDYMTDLLNQNRYLKSGSKYVQKYVSDPNEKIRVAGLGMVTGAQKVIEANDNFSQILLKTDLNNPKQLQEIEFQVAKYISDQKDGYGLIAKSAPWVTALFFEPAHSKDPSGNIPYTISKEQRALILNEIDRLFGNDLIRYRLDKEDKTGRYNAILFAVNTIYNNLAPDTHEQASKLD